MFKKKKDGLEVFLEVDWIRKSEYKKLEAENKKLKEDLPVLLNNYARNCINDNCSLCGSDLKKAREFLEKRLCASDEHSGK